MLKDGTKQEKFSPVRFVVLLQGAGWYLVLCFLEYLIKTYERMRRYFCVEIELEGRLFLSMKNEWKYENQNY